MEKNNIGKSILKFRKENKMSQIELAKLIGVSNKSISQWETGYALPSINDVIKISNIFNVSIDKLLESENKINKEIFKIVLTGGPCSGKSTALNLIEQKFSKLGYFVMINSEVATDFIMGGIAPWTIDTTQNYESYIIKMQIEKEKIFEEAAKHITNYDKILIVCDRGIPDCKAYMTNNEFESVLTNLNTDEVTIRDSYDAVFHLVSAAIGAEKYYSNSTNSARYESLEEARIQDKKTMSAWIGHPHLRVIDNSTDFDEKMKKLISEILSFLGEPCQYEIERKYLIKKPDINRLEKLDNCKKVEILQTYLSGDENSSVRVRQRGENGHYTYTKTTKIKISDIKRIENEIKISKKEYLNLLLQADTTKHQIRKTRYLLMYKNQYFEIDIFPNFNDTALMEIELRDENQIIELPNFIEVINEVTSDPNYLNINIAKN